LGKGKKEFCAQEKKKKKKALLRGEGRGLPGRFLQVGEGGNGGCDQGGDTLLEGKKKGAEVQSVNQEKKGHF